MQHRALAIHLLFAASVVAPAYGCGSEPNQEAGGGSVATGPGSGGNGGSAPVYADVQVDPPTASLEVPLGGTVDQAFTATASVDGVVRDVTGECDWSVDGTYGTMSESTLSAKPRGGATAVVATCGSVTGSADVTIKVVADVIGPGAPMNAPDQFAAATPGDDPSRTPAIEYPANGAVAPRNLPSVEVQYTTAGSDLFRVSYASDFVDVSFYTTAPEATLSSEDWQVIAESSQTLQLQFTVEGILQSDPAEKFASQPVSLKISRDSIEKSAIYWWASSQGELITQTFGNTGAPSPVRADCTSCHSVSRSGQRVGYSRCLNEDCNTIRVGFMRYDQESDSWADTYDANQSNIIGSYTTFAPVGNPFPDDSEAVAAVSMSNGSLALYDPDLGAPVASNLDQASTALGTRSALMPDWSPDGAHITFASSPNLSQWIDLDGSAIARVGYTFDGTTHAFGDLELLVEGPIERPSGTFTNFFFPSYSTDGSLIVFNGARSAWRGNGAAPGQRLFLAAADGSWNTELEALNGGAT